MFNSITPEIIEKWDSSGKSEVLILLGKEDTLESTLYELTIKTIEEKIKVSQFISLVTTFTSELETSKDFISTLTDVLWMIDQIKCEKGSTSRKIFMDLMKELTTSSVLNESILKSRLELETVEELGLIKRDKFIRKISQLRANEFYKQDKFNLLSEESEGYSKLFIELCTTSQTPKNQFNSLLPQKIENVKKIIGTFSLDPNRVFDILLEVYEYIQSPFENWFVELFSSLYKNYQYLFQLLCVKFKWFHKKNNIEKTNKSLFFLTARLITMKFIKIEDIYPYLLPNDKEFFQSFHKRINFIMKNNIAEVKDERDFKLPYNQKMMLLSQLLETKDLENSMKLMNVLGKFFPSYYPEVYKPLLRILDDLVKPIYKNISVKLLFEDEKKEFVYTEEMVKQLKMYIFPIVVYLGPQLGKNIVLYTKIIRLIINYFFKTKDTENCITLSASLMAGLTTSKLNVGASYELWDLLKKFKFKQRYEIYGLFKNIIKENLILMYQFAKVRKASSVVLKRVVTENTREKGKAFAKVYISFPMATCENIVNQLYYEVFVVTIIDMLKYSNPMIRDLLVFRILSILSAFGGPDSIEKFGEDQYSPSNKLKNYGRFIGLLCRKFPLLDLSPIILFIENQIKFTSWVDLYLFRQIIKNISGEEIYDQIKSSQIEALAGGHNLRLESGFDSSVLKRRKRSTAINRLSNWLVSEKCRISHSLIDLLSKLRKNSIFADSEHRNFNRAMYSQDKCQNSLLLLLQFLKYNAKYLWEFEVDEKVPVNKFFLVPSLSKLYENGTEPEIIFAITRPTFDGLNIEESLNKFDLEAIKKFVPPSIGNDEGALKLYLLFWVLDTFDIYVPSKSYDKTISNLNKSASQQIQELKNKSRERDRDRGVRAVEAEIKKLNAIKSRTIKALENEKKFQIEHTKRVEKYLRSLTILMKIPINDFLKFCVYPRSSISTTDSIFCSHFVELFQRIDKPIFEIYEYLRKIYEDLPSWFLFSTGCECVRIARFFKYHLIFMKNRLINKNIYKGKRQLTYELYKTFCYRVHGQFTFYLTNSFSNINFEIKKNLIRVLNEIKMEYPEYQVHGDAVLRHMVKIKKELEREEDALFTSYIGYLEKRVKSGRMTKTPRNIKRSEKRVFVKIDERKNERKLVKKKVEKKEKVKVTEKVVEKENGKKKMVEKEGKKKEVVEKKKKKLKKRKLKKR